MLLYFLWRIFNMKSIFTFFFFSFITAYAFANDVTVFFKGDRNYQIVIDGQTLYANQNASNSSIYLPNLSVGNHSIEVYRLQNNKKWWKNNKPVYASSFTVRPQFDVFINVDDDGGVRIDERRENNSPYRGRNNDYDRNNGNWDDRDYNDRRNDNNGYDRRGNGNKYRTAISDRDFNQMVQYIKSQWLNNRLSTAKSAVSTNYLNTFQLKQLLQLFSFDNEKLELTKQAYRNIIDVRNFYQVYDAFSFQNSRDELDKFVREARY